MKREESGSYIGEYNGVVFRVYCATVTNREYSSRWVRSKDWRAVIAMPGHPRANKGGNIVFEGQGTKAFAEITARKFIDKMDVATAKET
jgi:hypothetical protein